MTQHTQHPHKQWQAATHAIHGREDTTYRAAVYPIYQTSTFGVHQTADYLRFFHEGEADFYVYTRAHNPTVRNVEERLAKLEHAEDGVLFSSGMAAVSSAILSVVSAGETLVSSRPVYGGTYHLLMQVAPRLGIQTVFLDADELYHLRDHVPDAKAVYFETPANPTIQVLDIERIVSAARQVGAVTIIDNTFASPINQTPLDLGVDMALHSATKYIGGHSDVISGAVLASQERIAAVREMLMVFGGCASPLEAFLLDRSLKTLPVRIRQTNENAMQLAQFFADDARIETVHYPGLPTSPDYAVACKQMHGFGGMLAIDLPTQEAAIAFCDAVQIGLNAVSLGGVETLITMPGMSTHSTVDEDALRIARVQPGTVRISVGIEAIDDLLDDFAQALDAAETVMSAAMV